MNNYANPAPCPWDKWDTIRLLSVGGPIVLGILLARNRKLRKTLGPWRALLGGPMLGVVGTLARATPPRCPIQFCCQRLVASGQYWQCPTHGHVVQRKDQEP